MRAWRSTRNCCAGSQSKGRNVKLTRYLTLEELLELHRRALVLHGGSDGVRDMGLVESALARPKSGYYESLSEQAASLLQSFAGNHAFIDGNKRVAWLAADVFLRINGHKLHLSASVAERFILNRVIKKHIDVHEIAKWLEKYMVAR